jgi:hypothetical protein
MPTVPATAPAPTTTLYVLNDVVGESWAVEVSGNRNDVIGRLYLVHRSKRTPGDVIGVCLHVYPDRLVLHLYAEPGMDAVAAELIAAAVMAKGGVA